MPATAPARKSKSHKAAARAPRVGEVVLLRVDVGVQLPLLVTRVTVVPRSPFTPTRWTVSGQVFTDPTVHNDAAWIRETRFWKPSAEQPTFLLSDVVSGPDVGQWELLPCACK